MFLSYFSFTRSKSRPTQIKLRDGKFYTYIYNLLRYVTIEIKIEDFVRDKNKIFCIGSLNIALIRIVYKSI